MNVQRKKRVLAILLLIGIFLLPGLSGAEEKWQGVDKTVVEQFAKENGREVREPLINTDKGDLLLFIFLVSGAGAGFAAGYYWRKLTAENKGIDRK